MCIGITLPRNNIYVYTNWIKKMFSVVNLITSKFKIIINKIIFQPCRAPRSSNYTLYPCIVFLLFKKKIEIIQICFVCKFTIGDR